MVRRLVVVGPRWWWRVGSLSSGPRRRPRLYGVVHIAVEPMATIGGTFQNGIGVTVTIVILNFFQPIGQLSVCRPLGDKRPCYFDGHGVDGRAVVLTQGRKVQQSGRSSSVSSLVALWSMRSNSNMGSYAARSSLL
jgi:hypothetical protein